MKDLYIVIPAYNEESVIATVLESLQKNGWNQIIVVDDGSKDDTFGVAKKHGAITLRHKINRGAGAATQTGFDAAKLLGAQWAITIDADAQHSADDVQRVVDALATEEMDVVIGSRFLRKNKIPILRRFFNKLGNFFTFLICGLWVSDSQTGFKGFNRKALDTLHIQADGYEFCTELIRLIAVRELRLSEVPIHVKYTKYSLTKGQNFASGMKTALKLIVRTLMRVR